MKLMILLSLMMGTHALAANQCNHNGVTMQSGQKECIDHVYVSCQNGDVSFVGNGECPGAATTSRGNGASIKGKKAHSLKK
jgi:hypothetical protein